MKRLKPLMLSVALLFPMGLAQTTEDQNTTSKITSVGDQLLWNIGNERFTIQVTETSPVTISLLSPTIHTLDRASGDYFGDEKYGKDQMRTTYTLLDEQGLIRMTHTYGEGKSEWVEYFNGHLTAGTYTLDVKTKGDGKNTYAVKLGGEHVALSAQFANVNVHGQNWTEALKFRVNNSDETFRLQMYDGDGAGELEAQLEDPFGNRWIMTVSGDKSWNEVTLPKMLGEFKMLLRQPSSARQFSNTVSFRLMGKPLPLAGVTSQVQVNSELLTPYGKTKLPTRMLIGSQSVLVAADGTQIKMTPGTYPVVANEIPGTRAEVFRTFTVKEGETSTLLVQYIPVVTGQVKATRTDVKVGEEFTVVIESTTEFSGSLKAINLLSVPTGITAKSSLAGTGLVKSDRTLSHGVILTANTPGTYTLMAEVQPWGLKFPITITAKE